MPPRVDPVIVARGRKMVKRIAREKGRGLYVCKTHAFRARCALGRNSCLKFRQLLFVHGSGFSRGVKAVLHLLIQQSSTPRRIGKDDSRSHPFERGNSRKLQVAWYLESMRVRESTTYSLTIQFCPTGRGYRRRATAEPL